MALLTHTSAGEHRPLLPLSRAWWKDRAAQRRARIEAVQRYRTMTGMDEPLERRASRARVNAAKLTPKSTKTW